MKIFKINGAFAKIPDNSYITYIDFIADTFRDYLDFLFLLAEYNEPSGSQYRLDINLALENFITIGQDNKLDEMIQNDEFSNRRNIFILPWFVGAQFYSDTLYIIKEPNSHGDLKLARVNIFNSREVLAKEVVIW